MEVECYIWNQFEFSCGRLSRSHYLDEGACDRSKTSLRSMVAKDLPEAIVVDSIRLRQILLNLLSNAVNFAAGGTVMLEVEW